MARHQALPRAEHSHTEEAKLKQHYNNIQGNNNLPRQQVELVVVEPVVRTRPRDWLCQSHTWWMLGSPKSVFSYGDKPAFSGLCVTNFFNPSLSAVRKVSDYYPLLWVKMCSPKHILNSHTLHPHSLNVTLFENRDTANVIKLRWNH